MYFLLLLNKLLQTKQLNTTYIYYLIGSTGQELRHGLDEPWRVPHGCHQDVSQLCSSQGLGSLLSSHDHFQNHSLTVLTEIPISCWLACTRHSRLFELPRSLSFLPYNLPTGFLTTWHLISSRPGRESVWSDEMESHTVQCIREVTSCRLDHIPLTQSKSDSTHPPGEGGEERVGILHGCGSLGFTLMCIWHST